MTAPACIRPVVSFPKSGRTWLRYAATLAGLEPEFTHAGHPTHIDRIGYGFQGIPYEFDERDVFFLHRNPLDTAVSYYFQILHKDCVPGRKTWHKFIRDRGFHPPTDINKFVVAETWGVPLICEFNRAWIDYLTPKTGTVILTYEHLKEDPTDGLARFFDAMGHPDVDAADIAARTSFEAMRDLQASEDGPLHRLTQPFANDPESAKVRRGQVKGYKQYLDRTTIKLAAKIAARYGFTV
jgi:hypothetical protein